MMVFVAVLTLQAQTLNTIFVNMPDSLSPLLTKNDRADFADFLDSKMKAQVKNKFEKVSEMKILTKDYLFLQTTSQTILQMKLLPINDSTKIVCLITTACAPACDSRIRFFTPEWKELSAKEYVTLPTIDAFWQFPDSINHEQREIIRDKMDSFFLKAELAAVDNSLTFSNTTMDYLDKDTAKELLIYLKQTPIKLQWSEGGYRKK